MKRIIALLLCLATVLCVFVSCGEDVAEDYMGQEIKVYLSEPIYNFDPAYAYGNESALKLVSLLYENLFVLDANGNPQKSLVKDYVIDREENTMLITLREDSYWSDGAAVSSNDVVFAWQRILDSGRSFEAASLLYDIKNAKAVKQGTVASIDDAGIQALNKSEILIEFESNVDYDNFIRNLTCYALAPLRSDVLERTMDELDWAKSTTTIVTSGPFKVRKVSFQYEDGKDSDGNVLIDEETGEPKDPADAGVILERNPYYRRDYMEDKVDKAVTPYRLIIDYTMTDKEILSAYEKGELYFIGDVPLSIRKNAKIKGQTATDSMSTHSYLINQNAIVRYYKESKFSNLEKTSPAYDEKLVEGKDGEKIFAIPEVREALSLAINRESIAEKVVFAEKANGLVPNGVFETTASGNLFRNNDSNLKLAYSLKTAKQKLAEADVDASKFMIAISVPAYDDVHLAIAKKVKTYWEKLGFHVAINAIETIENSDKLTGADQAITGIKDDLFHETLLEGKFDVAAFDYCALTTDAMSVLAPFAKGYTGGASRLSQSPEFAIATHFTGYNNENYNDLINKAYGYDIEDKDYIKALEDALKALEVDLPKKDKNVTYSQTLRLELEKYMDPTDETFPQPPKKSISVETRAKYLHEAEKLLMEDLPIIPIVFNKSVTMISDKLENVTFTYYNTPIFDKANATDIIPPKPTETETETETDETSEDESSTDKETKKKSK